MKARYGFAIALGIVTAIIVAGGAVLFETQAGLNWAVGIAESHSGGVLRIGAARGRLAGPVSFDDVTLKLANATITAQEIKLDWRPSELAAGKLHVTRLSGSGIAVVTQPNHKASSGLPRKLHLPLHVIVAGAELKDLRLKTATRTLRLDRLAFALNADDDHIRLDKLETRGPRLALAGQLRLEPHGDWKLDGALALILRPRDYPAVEGRTRIEGALRGRVHLVQTLRTPFRATLDAEATDILTQAEIRGSLAVAGLNPGAIKARWPNLPSAARLDFAGSRKAFTARGTVTLHGERSRTVGVDLAAGFEEQRLRVAHLNLVLRNKQIAGTPPRLGLRGTIALKTPYTAQLNLAWRDLAWPLDTRHPILRAARGGARIEGSLDAWYLDVFTRLRPAGSPPGRWALAAHGDSQAAVLDALAGRWLGGRIAGQGRVQLAGERNFRLAVRTQDLHTEAIAKRLQGRLGFELTARGGLKPLQAHVRVARLTGKLHGRTVTGSAELDWTDGAVALHSLSLAAGPNRFSASGRWGERLDLGWRLRAPRLAALGAGLAGHLHAQGRIGGTAAKPRIHARLAAGDLRWRKTTIEKAQATIALNLAAGTPSALDLRIERLARENVELDTLTATLSGPADAERFTLDLNGNQGAVSLAGTGTMKHEVWHGKLVSGRLHPRKAPAFTLGAPASLVLGRSEQRLGDSCWSAAGGAHFCLTAASDAKGWRARLKLASLPLSLADPWLTDAVNLQGRLDGAATAAGGKGKLDVVAELHIGAGSVTRRSGGQTQRFGFSEAGLEARVNETTATARLGILLAAGGMLDARADVPWREHAEPAGRLHLVAHVPDLSGVGALTNALSNAGGRLDADFTVSGSPDAPRFAGDARLSQTRFTLTGFGTHIEDGRLAIRGDGPRLALHGSLADGAGGHLALHGSLARAGRQWALAMRVRGKRFRVADMPEARIQASPDLGIRLKDRLLRIEGSVAIPAARIKPPHFAKAIAPTSDLVIVGAKHKAGQPPLAVAARLDIRLGDDVHFDGYGLTARVGGELTLAEEPGKLTTASGELKILDGHYKAYGQDLDISRGRLLFSGGPIANPGLDIRATRTVALVTAGLEVTGTLRDPRLRVFSDPPMSQSNALAYLLFGHGVEQNSGSENSLYNQAANAIGIAGGTYIAKSLGKQVGIDTVSVENASRYSTNADQASLFLGKYLSPNLYVSYGIGLYEPINLLRVRYTLSRHWALEAESGSISGADILYNIEH